MKISFISVQLNLKGLQLKMEEKPERSHLSFIDDGEMDIPLAHLPKYTESPKNIIDIWLEKMGKGQLTPAHFKDHWRIWVPKLYALEPGSEWNLENDKSNCELLDNLEKFIANGDFKEVMEWLNCRNQSSSVCGKVFKVSFLCLFQCILFELWFNNIWGH